MKKSVFSLIVILFAGLALFTSCKKDDDVVVTPLTTPAYENVSAKYVVSGPSQYKSFELTASGNYIVMKNQGSYYGVKKFVGCADEATRATSYSNIIYGKFTKKSDTEFVLEGFGTIVIVGGTDNAVSLSITPNNGNTITLPAQRVEQQVEGGSFTDKICRTWQFASYRLTLVADGRTLFDGEYKSVSEMAQALAKTVQQYGGDVRDVLDVSEAEETAPDQIVFTKSGTYFVTYKNSTLAVSTWKWTDVNKGILHYSWDYNNMNAYGKSGDVVLSWRNNQLVVTESEEGEDRYSYMKLQMYLNEVK